MRLGKEAMGGQQALLPNANRSCPSGPQEAAVPITSQRKREDMSLERFPTVRLSSK